MADDQWSTPNAHDGRRPGSDATSTQGRNLKREAEDFLAHAELSDGGGNLMATPNHTGGQDLEGAVEQWQTPGTDSFRSRGGDRKDEMGLDQQARMLWTTPASRDWKGANSEAHVTVNGGGRKHMDQLSNQVEHSFLPDQPTETSGDASSPSGPTSRQHSRSRATSILSEPSWRVLAQLVREERRDGTVNESAYCSVLFEAARNSTAPRLNSGFVSWLQGLIEGWTSAAPINSAALAIWFNRCRDRLRSLCC